MGRVFLTCFPPFLLREKLYSSNNDEAVGFFNSLLVDLQKLEKSLAENSISLQWCMEAMNLLKKMHFQFLHFFEKFNVPISCDGVTLLDEYMEETLSLLDLCNLLKSAISGFDRYRLMVDFAVRKLYDDESSAATSKTEIERLERESKKLYGVEKWKDVNFYKACIPKTNSKDRTTHVTYAVKSTMTIISLLIFSAILYPIPIKMDEEACHKLPQLESFLGSLQKLVYFFCEKLRRIGDNSRPVLVENKMIEGAVADIKAGVINAGDTADKEKFLKNIDLLKKRSVVLKEGLEVFESAVTEVFEEVVKGRNKVLGTITET